MLQINDISIEFGGVKALSNISFEIEKKKITGLIGPNGAGKTSLFNIISGLYTPTTGTIHFQKQRVKKTNLKDTNLLGIARTFQNIMVFPDLTLLENVLIGRQSRTKANIYQSIFKTKFEKSERNNAKEKAMQLLENVDLAHKAHDLAKNLPYGEQRKLDIARALATDPELLLLDEPAAGLNLQERNSLKQLILKLNEIGYTIMLIEHDIKLVMGLCDYIIVLDHGEKISEGTPEYIQNDEKVIEAYLGKGREKIVKN